MTDSKNQADPAARRQVVLGVSAVGSTVVPSVVIIGDLNFH
jgi:hypothetical protein